MDKELLYDLYYNQKMSYRDIAEYIGKSEGVPKLWMKKYGFKPRNSSESCKLRCIKKPQTNPGRKEMPKNPNYGEKNHAYKGGYIRQDGCKVISVDGESRLEHRYIWEQHYKKPIPPGYQIHHINGDKLDNRIENLRCMSNSEHQKIHYKHTILDERKRFKKKMIPFE